ncbi:branched-chain amino acid ABC transporter permease [Conexibacter sp. CPCC 206217]|uniref:branched-chain amino acid ABC transporter permease n=1 Tax=Conexibacter sp. CPCC 206217 TaxID=3064574 RepID=UPI0027274815|nr:branched-chain amino acid ABC transporter permease [Conexibacter sp. CPCC 206217]MDO8211033.1 branched-chain amino acid ABC transporter permease [Conexibacter sp. CPCC 206217]
MIGQLSHLTPFAAASWSLFNQLLVSGIVLGSAYALLGVSLGLIYATTRTFHIAHAAVYTLAAYAAVVVATKAGAGLVLGVVAAIVVAVAAGLLIQRAGYRPMRRRGTAPMVMFLFSLGASVVVTNGLQLGFGPENQPLGGFPEHNYAVGDVRFTRLDVVQVAVAWALIAATVVFVRRSQYGRAITAVRTNEQMAAAVGIRVERIHRLVFALGSALAAVAAVLYTLGAVATPTMGLEPILLAFVAVFAGGVGSQLGAALGGLLLGLLMSLSGLWLASEFSLVVAFAVLFAVLIARPTGLLGRSA